MKTLSPFIVGVGRSGTTLLRMMLDSHPEFAIPAETHFIGSMTALADLRDAREPFLTGWRASERRQDFPISDQEMRDALGEAPLTISECIRCFFILYARKHGKARWGDKTPYYLTLMRDIAGMLPEAAFIHIIRDGRDVAVSHRPLWFSPGGDIRANAETWSNWILSARQQAAHLPHYLELRYENLIQTPAEELCRLCEFLGVEFDPVMLEYAERSADRLSELQDRSGLSAEKRRSIFELTKSAPDVSRIARWKTELNAEEVAEFEAIAGPMLRELGYA